MITISGHRGRQTPDTEADMVTIEGEWIEFKFFRPQARQVHLAGDFNNWRHGELPMSQLDAGYWVARLRLPAGEFRFRYCADGEWFTDYAAFGVEPGRFGLDSILRIPHKSLQMPVKPAAEKRQVAAA
jgi:1,4-alpha-glucan branching enzyme